MSDVHIRVFDEQDAAIDFGKQMKGEGYNVALSDSSTAVRLRYEVDGKSVAVTIKGDGSNFAVMAFDKP